MASDLFKQVETYPWDNDAEFQTGLNAILGNSTSPEQRDELALRARCFYYARYGPFVGKNLDSQKTD
jgi:hypothetical protein